MACTNKCPMRSGAGGQGRGCECSEAATDSVVQSIAAWFLRLHPLELGVAVALAAWTLIWWWLTAIS